MILAMLVVLAVAAALAWVGPNERDNWRLARLLDSLEETR